MAQPLDGIRVVEWAYYHVGPYCGTALADLGAEVIKIEDTGVGDPGRHNPIGPDKVMGAGNRGLFFEALNKGKKSIALDLKQEAAKEVVYRLVQKSDVFFTNFRYDAAQRLHLDYETLKKYNPKLIYGHASGFGRRGADANNPAFDLAGQARAGILMADTPPSGEPIGKMGIGDQVGSMVMAYGIVTALLARERLGVGQMLDTSIMGGIMWLSYTNMAHNLFGGANFSPQGWDIENPRSAQFTVYQCKDGKWLCLTGGMEQFWPPLCQAIGREDLVNDPRFKTREGREEHASELASILREAFRHKDRDEWARILKEVDYPGAPVNTPMEALNDPQAIANEIVVDYDHPLFGPMRVLGCPVHFHETPAQPRHRAPDQGEHTEEVLHDIVGCSVEEIDILRSLKVIL